MHNPPNIASQALLKALQDWPQWPILSTHTQSNCEFALLDKGLTNENWLVTLPNSQPTHNNKQQFVIRINASNAIALNLNREAEWHIQGVLAQAGIITPYLYRDKNDLYWIRPFVTGETLATTLTKSNDHTLTNKILLQICQHLLAIHKTPTSDLMPTIIFQDRTNYYWQQILEQKGQHSKQAKDELNRIKTTLDDQLNQQLYTPSLCHMDTNTHNWIISTHTLELIDWEYAAIGNPAWDLAVFCKSAKLNKTQIEYLLTNYGNINLVQLQHASKQMQYLSTLWFAVQQNTAAPLLIEQLKSIK